MQETDGEGAGPVYTDFYNLKEKPFNLSPSSRFLYLGEVHREALALLTYGVAERKGFILLTGEVGTGKTTMVQALLANLDHNVHAVHLSNPVLSPDDFIKYLGFSVFQRKVHFNSKAEFLIEFEAFLRNCLQQQKTFVLIIDEAQKLSFGLLEEIRLLSNMETADEKLINIFLVGQPELNTLLSRQECRPLLQRISIRYHMRPLDLDATRQYVQKRLKTAGAEDAKKIFPPDAISAIHTFSRGYPRMINVLADNALLLGYAKKKKSIAPRMIRECYRDIRPDMDGETEGHAPPQLPPPRKRAFRLFHWKALLLLVVAALAGAGLTASGKGQDLYERVAAFLYDIRPVEGDRTVQKAIPPPHEEAAPPTAEGTAAPPDAAPSNEVQTRPEAPRAQESPQASEREDVQGPSEAAPPPIQAEAPAAVKEPMGRIVVVKSGDTLTGLAAEIYGWTDRNVVQLLERSNPSIKDIDRIEVGQKILFPPLPDSRVGPTFTVHVATFKPLGFARKLFERLMAEGHEAYIIPVNDLGQGKAFRVTLGNFDSLEEAEGYAAKVLKEGISDYARAVRVDSR